MKPTILATAAVLTTISLSAPAQAENLQHISQLLSTKKCPLCDLSNAGLVMANLSRAQLRGADLSHANLSRANLTGADLSGADLSGASLHGANLSGANLTGANLNGTDLGNAYLVNANLTGVSLETAYVQGAIGIPNNAGTPELFYGWGVVEAKKGNYTAAIEHYTKAMSIDPKFAPAYLGRGFAYYRLGKEAEANQDAQIAAKLFEEQENTSGYQTSQNFIQAMELARNASNNQEDGGSGSFNNIFRGVAALLLQFIRIGL
ncbi:MAG: pentapeptide repeat-containing protein [Xenococcaceae cyanobacterium]